MFLRKGRTELRLTQEDVAEAMDCNATYYGNMERGVHYPSLGLFLRMVSYLHLSVDKFLENKEAVRPDVFSQKGILQGNA
ncbi:MAG: helix-turn-helix domain-containing protein [Mediterraneibacter gnavus]